MTKIEIKLEKEGYSFSGIYSFHKDEVEKRAKEERSKGYRARVLFVPASPYSRSHSGGGYRVLTKPTEKKRKELEAAKIAKQEKKLDNLKSIKDYLLTRTGDELVALFLELHEGREDQLIQWARKKNILS